MPIEADLLPVIEGYLDSRAIRFPTTLKSTSGHGLSRWPTIIVIPSNPIHTGERPALISGSRKRCGGPSASASSCSQAMSAAVSTRRNGVDAAVAAWRSKIDNAAHYMLEQLGPHANEPTAPGAAELSLRYDKPTVLDKKRHDLRLTWLLHHRRTSSTTSSTTPARPSANDMVACMLMLRPARVLRLGY